MTKREYEEIVAKIAAEVVERIKELDSSQLREPRKILTSTLITASHDKKVRTAVFQKVGRIIADGELSQSDPSDGSREYSFVVQYPNELTDDHMALLMEIEGIACVIVKPGETVRSFVVTLPFTLSPSLRVAIVRKNMPEAQDSHSTTGDKSLDQIIKRIDACVVREKDNDDQVTRSQSDILGNTVISFPLKAHVTNGSIHGIMSMGIVNKASLAASTTSLYPILRLSLPKSSE
jgi:hypothetical protein